MLGRLGRLRLPGLCVLLVALAGCGGGYNASPDPPPPPNLPPQPRFGHVFLLVEENHGYDAVIGNPDMPYFNSLASQYGLATQYYANTHPSIGDYFMLTTGAIQTNDSGFTGTISDDNLVRRLIAAGKTWKSYAESLPSAGYLGGNVYPYAKRHNPFAYFSDVIDDTAQAQNVVPFTQFPIDLAGGSLPNFSFIVPDLLNDAHDGTLAQADAWLQQNIDPLISSAGFQQDGLLIILFDEAETSDLSHGGGRIPVVIVSGKGKKQFQSQTFYQHESTLRLMLSVLGISSFPGAAATAPEMTEFF